MVQNNDFLRENAIILRKKGFSYLQISNNLSIPKSTLSSWFSKLKWSMEIKNKLISNQLCNPNKLLKANLARKKLTEYRHKAIIELSKTEFNNLKNDPLFLVGISLYWGEGEKTDSGRVSIINTDPTMILIMANFYRKCLEVEEKKLRVGLFIYEDLDQKIVTNYWSNILNIPTNQFIKTQILKSRSRLTTRKSKYGICSLYFSNTAISIKIRQWIRYLSDPGTLSGISLPVK